MCTHPGVD
jgi:hypothetical protein